VQLNPLQGEVPGALQIPHRRMGDHQLAAGAPANLFLSGPKRPGHRAPHRAQAQKPDAQQGVQGLQGEASRSCLVLAGL